MNGEEFVYGSEEFPDPYEYSLEYVCFLVLRSLTSHVAEETSGRLADDSVGRRGLWLSKIGESQKTTGAISLLPLYS